MEHPLIHDRGRGPELVGTRITVYNLVPYFIKAEWTEAAIAEANRITEEQVAAMRAYFLAHYADVMAQHERIEEWIRKGTEDQAKRFPDTRCSLSYFPTWVQQREREAAAGGMPFPDSPQERVREFLAWRERSQLPASNEKIPCAV
jgi:uncharacterized protein (DUF433 family)